MELFIFSYNEKTVVGNDVNWKRRL